MTSLNPTDTDATPSTIAQGAAGPTEARRELTDQEFASVAGGNGGVHILHPGTGPAHPPKGIITAPPVHGMQPL